MQQPFPSTPIAAVTHPDPYPYYADLRSRAPFDRHEALGLWVAASAEAVTAVLTSALGRVRPPAEPVPNALLGSSAAEIFGRLVRMNDGPSHQALKPAVISALGSLDGEAAARPSAEWARRLVPETDDLNALLFRLPVSIVASLLGVPEETIPELVRWMGDFAPALAPGGSPEQVERGKQAADRLLGLFRGLWQGGPRGLLATLAREAGPDGADLVVANAIGFLFQTHDATAGLIGNTLLALARNPEARRQAAGDPALLHQALLETLRHDPPVQNTRRFIVADGMIAGRQLRAGDAVLAVLAAANRDPAANPEPDHFDLLRPERRSFTFGRGVHACPGETLAVTIAQAAVDALLRSGLDLEKLQDGVAYRPSANGRIPVFRGAPAQVSGQP